VPDLALTISEMDVALAWNVRGDAARPAFPATVEKILGVPLPRQPHATARGDAGALLSLGPRSWLFVGGRTFAGTEFDAARKALNAADGALFDVSSSYVAWTLSGEAATRTLNRGCPLDLHPSVFRPGQCAQSLLGHVNAIFYRPDERDAWIVMVARSFAADAWEQLDRYASTDGYAMGPPTTFGANAAK
jgi:sarcosine oxidase subunit gamma